MVPLGSNGLKISFQFIHILKAIVMNEIHFKKMKKQKEMLSLLYWMIPTIKKKNQRI